MSGDVQPRKRKEKRKKKEEEELLPQHVTNASSDEIIHIHKETKLGGNFCSKIVFFCLLGALGIMVGLIILEYHGTSEKDVQSAVGSPWSVMFEGWVDDNVDHKDHDDDAEHYLHEDEDNHDDDDEKEEDEDTNLDDEEILREDDEDGEESNEIQEEVEENVDDDDEDDESFVEEDVESEEEVVEESEEDQDEYEEGEENDEELEEEDEVVEEEDIEDEEENDDVEEEDEEAEEEDEEVNDEGELDDSEEEEEEEAVEEEAVEEEKERYKKEEENKKLIKSGTNGEKVKRIRNDNDNKSGNKEINSNNQKEYISKYKYQKNFEDQDESKIDSIQSKQISSKGKLPPVKKCDDDIIIDVRKKYLYSIMERLNNMEKIGRNNENDYKSMKVNILSQDDVEIDGSKISPGPLTDPTMKDEHITQEGTSFVKGSIAEEEQDETSGVALKFGVGVALVFVAHVVLIRKWSNGGLYDNICGFAWHPITPVVMTDST